MNKNKIKEIAVYAFSLVIVTIVLGVSASARIYNPSAGGGGGGGNIASGTVAGQFTYWDGNSWEPTNSNQLLWSNIGELRVGAVADQGDYSFQVTDGAIIDTLTLSNDLDVSHGGTGTGTPPSAGSMLIWDGSNYGFVASSTLGGGGSGSGTVNSGTQGQVSYYASNGTAVSGTSSLFIGDDSNVGIGTTSPQSKLSVVSNGTGIIVTGPNGSAGVSAAAEANDIVIDNNSNSGISVLGSDDGDVALIFGTPSDSAGAQFYWNHDNDILTLGSSNAGASVRITSGNLTEAIRLDSSGNIKVGVQLDLNEKTILYNESPTSDDTWNGDVINATAGENVSKNDVCYLGSDSKFYKADADIIASSTSMLVMSTASITANNSGNFIIKGFMRDDGSFNYTAGNILYTSLTPGIPTETAPSATGDIVRIIGYAFEDDVVYFNPSHDYIEIQ